MTTTFLGQRVSGRAKKLVEASSILGDDAIELTSRVGSGLTSEWVRRGTTEAMDRHQCDHYTRRPGLAALCQRVAELLLEHGIDVNPDSGVLITGSVQEARFVALRSLAVGKTVFVPQPSAVTYNAGADFAGATIQTIDLDKPLPAASGDLLIVPNPNPTTGHLLEQATLDRLAAWAVDIDLTVVADETLAPALAPESAFSSIAVLPDMASRTVVLGSYAAPGLAAWQVSWIAGPTALVTTVRDVKQAMTICTPAPSQYAALASFDNPSEQLLQGRDER